MIILLMPSLIFADDRPPCDSEIGVCLNGKRSTFYPDHESIVREACEGYPIQFINCYINRGAREFSWRINPTTAIQQDSSLLMAPARMTVTSKFSIFASPSELEIVRSYADSYTINLSFDINYAGYNRLITNNLGYAFRAQIALTCDGKPLEQNEAIVGFQPGGYGDRQIARSILTAVFTQLSFSECERDLTAVLSYEGQIFQLNKMELAVLSES